MSEMEALRRLAVTASHIKVLQKVRQALTDAAIEEALSLYEQSCNQFYTEKETATVPINRPSQVVYTTELADQTMASVTLKFVTQTPTAKNNKDLAEIEELLQYNINQLRHHPSHTGFLSRIDQTIGDLKARIRLYETQVKNLEDERIRYCQSVSREVEQLLEEQHQIITNCTVKQPQLAVEVKPL